MSGNFFRSVFALLAILACFASPVSAEDILLGEYDFTTGTDQLKASNVADGVLLGDIVIDGSKLTSNFTGDAVELSNWATFMAISNGKCINVPVTKSGSANEFNISRVDVTLKRSEGKKIQINFGNEVNTYDSKTFAAGTLIGNDTYATYSLTENTNTGNAGVSVIPVPAVTGTETLYLSIGTMATLTTDVVYVDKIAVYGTVDINLDPTISWSGEDRIYASKGHAVTVQISLSGANLTDATTLSLTGTDAALFETDKSSISAVELNSGVQSVNLTYLATASSFDRVSGTEIPHQVNLHVANPGVAAFDIPVTATCDLLYEDFSNYDLSATSLITLSELGTITDDVDQSLISGWTGDLLYQYKAGSPNLGSACLGSTASDSSWLSTPELDLSQPFTVKFKARSLSPGSDGNFYVYLDGDRLIYSGTNQTNTLKLYASEAFVGTAASKLTFTGRRVDLNEIIVDSIVVNNSNNPALNFALNKTVDFGSVSRNRDITVDIPVQGYNLTGDVSFALQSGTEFSIVSDASVLQSAAAAGVSVSVKFSAPNTIGAYQDVLLVTTSDLTAREIVLTAISNLETGNDAPETGKIMINGSGVLLSGYESAHVSVFDIAGVKIHELNGISENEQFDLPVKGCYIFRIEKAGVGSRVKVILK